MVLPQDSVPFKVRKSGMMSPYGKESCDDEIAVWGRADRVCAEAD